MIYDFRDECERLMHRARRLLLLLAATVSVTLNTVGAETISATDGTEFFEKKIRPLLTERCYTCHSAVSEKLKGGLRLDSREAMLRGGDTRSAIMPGEPEKSLLIEAVRYGNSDLQMPPKKRLLEAEIADLASWIRMGAPWPSDTRSIPTAVSSTFNLAERRQRHWSWKPVQPVAPPVVKQSEWPISTVDRFILAKLEMKDLSPAPPADRRSLIRRAYFDLIGLPPTPAEVEAFLADGSPGAFETVVDRLLASPRFGERWARHWLDLARYSETLGHEFDYPNFNAWRYRDYVIRAFNSDLPYDEFVVEQIAGDLLERPRRDPTGRFNESVIGTGFFWLGQRVHSPVDVRQEQAEVVDNQIDVTCKTFLGLTVACARCHDHKFDAISTRDYYSLFGVLGSSRYSQRSLDGPEAVAGQIKELKSLKNELRPLIGKVWLGQASKLAGYLAAANEVGTEQHGAALTNRLLDVSKARQIDATRLERWIRALQTNEGETASAAAATWIKLAGISAPANHSSFQHRLRDIWQNSEPAGVASLPGETFAGFSGSDFSLWSVEDEAFGASSSAVGDFVVGDPSRPVISLLTERTANSACVSRRLEGTLRSPTFTIRNRYAHILACGSESRLNVRVDNFTMIREPIYGGLKRVFDNESLRWITVDLNTWKGHRAYLEFDDLSTPDPSDEADKTFSPLAYVAVSRVIFSEAPAPPCSPRQGRFLSREVLAKVGSTEQLAAAYQQQTETAVRAWAKDSLKAETGSAQVAWLDWLNRNGLLQDELSGEAQRLKNVLRKFRTIEDSIPEHTRAVGMVDGTGVDENVFIRGSHKTFGEVVPRRFLEALGGSDKARFTQGSGRLELARCLVNPSNPLLARVMVNRIWLHLFGRGIVPTPDDFGALGQAPTHPELLDWLANWYSTEGRWSNKRLIRMLVTSQTYRMSSKLADHTSEEKDPQNVLLHRMPVRRLEYEPIRDSILAVSGQLDLQMFGPPVAVYLTEFMEGRGRPAHSGPIDGARRRSIYQDVRRNFLAPSMRAFDFPVPSTTVGRRTVSNVPAQSLILMNDPFVIGQAALWAKSLLAESKQAPDQRIKKMYETLFSRPPLPAELAETMAFLDQQAEAYGLDALQRQSDAGLWTDLCQALMNVKEFIFVN
jgi:hypothetical protein